MSQLLSPAGGEGAHSEREAFSIPVGGILLIQHIIQGGNLPVGIGNLRNNYLNTPTNSKAEALAYNWELDISRSKLGTIFIDIFDPCMVVLKAVGRDANNLHVALFKIRNATSDLTKLSGADGREITGVREQDGLGYN